MPKDKRYGIVLASSTETAHMIPQDEPVFILRAQDKLAPVFIRAYAELRGVLGEEGARKRILEVADEFERWPKRKMPDE